MQIFHSHMVKNGEVIPKDAISYAVCFIMVDIRCISRMSHLSCEYRVTAEDAEGIDRYIPVSGQMPDAVMDSIEESLSVKGTAFEYYGKSFHHHLSEQREDTGGNPVHFHGKSCIPDLIQHNIEYLPYTYRE